MKNTIPIATTGLALAATFLIASTGWGLDPSYLTHVVAGLRHTNQQEILAGKLAEQKAQSPDVRDYGTALKNEHERSDIELLAFAGSNGIPIEEFTPRTEQEKRDMQWEVDTAVQLYLADPAVFDKMFLQAMVKAHQLVVAQLRTMRTGVEGHNLHVFIDSVMPMFLAHERKAQALLFKTIR
jgi:putative membrane protein